MSYDGFVLKATQTHGGLSREGMCSDKVWLSASGASGRVAESGTKGDSVVFPLPPPGSGWGDQLERPEAQVCSGAAPVRGARGSALAYEGRRAMAPGCFLGWGDTGLSVGQKPHRKLEPQVLS